MGLVLVTAAEAARGVFVGHKGRIIPVDHGSQNEKLREVYVDVEDVAGMVKRGLILQPSTAQLAAGEGAKDEGTADILAGKASAGAAAAEHGDETPVTTTALTNFPEGHPSRTDSPGLPGAAGTVDAEAAAAALGADDEDAAPPAKRPGRPKKED